jgi:hypothetical protein
MEEQTLSIAHNPWGALTGEIQPTIQFVKRGRGRPRKNNLPTCAGKITHKMGDREIKEKTLSFLEHQKMVDQFKKLRSDHNLQEALSVIASKFSISYAKAFNELNDYF